MNNVKKGSRNAVITESLFLTGFLLTCAIFCYLQTVMLVDYNSVTKVPIPFFIWDNYFFGFTCLAPF